MQPAKCAVSTPTGREWVLLLLQDYFKAGSALTYIKK
uniref:Uncharacterized protein n=1 Tax=Anguilla anguilla TaxID=7936 RepID=A0A0E9X2U4_ANGAN